MLTANHNLKCNTSEGDCQNLLRSWVRHMVVAIDHYLAFQRLAFQNKEDLKGANLLSRLQAGVLAPFMKRVSKSRKASGLKKLAKDATALKSVAPPDVIKAAIFKAMCDLQSIHDEYAGEEEMPLRVRWIVLAILLGITFLNQYAGRTGEWAKMMYDTAVNQLASGKSYFECGDHKTAETYGVLGKHISPGTRVAYLKYIELPRVQSWYFFDSCGNVNDCVSVANGLRSFFGSYVPEYPAMTATLIRKQMHTESQQVDGQEKCLAALCAIDGHSPSVAHSNYIAVLPEEMAKNSKSIFEAFMGEAVAWPSDDELAKNKRAVSEIVARHTAVETADADELHISEPEDEKDVNVTGDTPRHSGRSIAYSPKTGVFRKNEVKKPNMLAHTAPKKFKQTILKTKKVPSRTHTRTAPVAVVQGKIKKQSLMDSFKRPTTIAARQERSDKHKAHTNKNKHVAVTPMEPPGMRGAKMLTSPPVDDCVIPARILDAALAAVVSPRTTRCPFDEAQIVWLMTEHRRYDARNTSVMPTSIIRMIVEAGITANMFVGGSDSDVKKLVGQVRNIIRQEVAWNNAL
jgi:hypothetical protein